MRLLLVWGALAWLAAAGAAQHHDPLYVTGGYWSTSSLPYNYGLWLADARNQTYTSLVRPGNYSYCHIMDADNQRIVFTVFGSTTSLAPMTSGVFRYDPTTRQASTVLSDPNLLYRPYNLIINQDGDYVLGCYARATTSSLTYRIYKLDQARTLTTLLDAKNIKNQRAYFNFHLRRNMDTGRYLVNNGYSPYRIWELADDGTLTTWSTGGGYGWYGLYSLPQDHDTGWIEGPYSNTVYRLKPGSTSRTTLYFLGRPYGVTMGNPAKFDLQSAASKRWVVPGYTYRSSTSTYEAIIFYVDQKTFAVSTINCAKNAKRGDRHQYFYDLDFYRGRHIQTVKSGPRKWDIFLSCPNFPGRPYVLAIGASGYRPGVKLPDGRTIHLNLDDAVQLSIRNLLRPYFDPGSGYLDAQGRGFATLDLSAFKTLNAPVWIAMAVLDPQAPLGVAYLPDTYVMRL